MGKNSNFHGDDMYDDGVSDKLNFKQYINELREHEIATESESETINVSNLFSKEGLRVIGLSREGRGEDLQLSEDEWLSIKSLAANDTLNIQHENLDWEITLDSDKTFIFDSGPHGSYVRIKRQDAIRKFS